MAVRGLSLAVKKGECFGLLGPNGAGKVRLSITLDVEARHADQLLSLPFPPPAQTTTISMLTGNTPPSGGEAWVAGLDISRRMREAYPRMGVCPQDNLLWNELTGREHLHFYGRLKGLHGESIRL